MPVELVNVGTEPNDSTGDDLRSAGLKLNQKFAELDATIAALPAGIDGVDGKDGLQGPVGPVGPEGPQGIQGEVGDTGATGSQGPQGLPGIEGPVGPQGPAGVDGKMGPQGLPGITGPQGEPGVEGSTGPQGPAGADGVVDEARLTDINQAIILLQGRIEALEAGGSISFGIKNIDGNPVITAQDGTLSITIESGPYAGTYAADYKAVPIAVSELLKGPIALVRPVISGTAGARETLTAQPTLWLYAGEDPGEPSYQWQRDGVDIAGATALTYTQVAADEGMDLTVREMFDGVSVDSLVVSVPLAAFDPQSITSLAEELDAAANPSTITESGGAVSAWGDTNENANNWTQNTVSKQPNTDLVTQNGLNTVSFDGSEFFETVGTKTFSPSGTMFMAFQVNSVASLFNSMFAVEDGTQYVDFRAGSNTWFGEIDSTQHSLLARSTEVGTAWVVQAYRWDIASNTASLWTNGVMDAQVTDYNTAYTAIPTRMVIVANRTTNGNPNSNVGQFWRFSEPLSDAVMGQMFTHAQTRWGV